MTNLGALQSIFNAATVVVILKTDAGQGEGSQGLLLELTIVRDSSLD